MVALPSGWIDTGQTMQVVVTAGARIRMVSREADGPVVGLGAHGSLEEGVLTVEGTLDLVDTDEDEIPDALAGTIIARINGIEVEQVTYPGTLPGALIWSAWYDYEATAGPYRLGVRRTVIAAFGLLTPRFVQHLKVEYAWFADENTERSFTFGPSASAVPNYWTSMGWAASPEPGLTPEQEPFGFGDGSLSAGAGGEAPDGCLQIRDWTINDVVTDVSTLSDTVFLGSGSTITVDDYGAGLLGSVGIGLPYRLRYDLDVLKSTGGESTGAQVETVNRGTVTVPYTASVDYQNTSWDGTEYTGTEALTVNAAWAAAQAPPWDPADLRALIFGIPPRHEPDTATPYYPLTVDVAAFRELKPLTLINILGGTDPATYSLAATYGAPGTDLPEWRTWLGVGVSGKADAAFNPDLESRTRTDGTAPWAWDAYSYLVFKLVSIAATTLTLTVQGVRVSVSDNHETGSSRTDAFAATETPFTATYQVPIRLSAGPEDAQAYKVDLLFPHSATVDGVAVDLAASAPFYLGRIDGWSLTGFNAVGAWVFTEFGLRSLVAPDNLTDPGLVTFKHACGAPVQRGDYDAAQLAHNGAAGQVNLTDRTNCTELFGHDGRGVRAFSILTGAGTGTILDAQYDLSEYAEWLGNVEAWDVVYDESAASAALSDGTNTLATYAQDLAPQLPGVQFTADAGTSLPAWVMCGELDPAPGIPFLIYSRDVLGNGALEAQTHSGRRRGPAGRTVTLTNGQSAATDAHGYVQWGAVGANGLVGVGVGESLVALRAHDKRRLEVALAALGRLWPFNLADCLWHFYNRTHVNTDSRVEVALRRSAGPVRPFENTAVITEVGALRPVLCRDHRLHLHLFYERDGGGVYHRESWDDGKTFLEAELRIPGGRVPFADTDPDSKRILAAALVGSQVVGKLRDPNRQWSAAFTFAGEGGGALLFDEEDTFSFTFSGDAQGRLIGAFHISGEDDISEWWSPNFGRSWSRVPD